MPLYKSNAPTATAQSLIWKIEEPESFFSKQLGFSGHQKTEPRRLEYLATRYLLQHLIPDISFSDLKCHPEGKPFLDNSHLHFSISHSFPFVAVALDQQPIGIDIQVFQQKIIRLQQKFLSPEEQILFKNEIEKITLAWTAKEAAFKWFGEGKVDFIQHMPIRKLAFSEQNAHLEMDFLRTNPQQKLLLTGAIEPEFAWSVTIA